MLVTMSSQTFEQQNGAAKQQSPVYVDYEKFFSPSASKRQMPVLRKNAIYMLTPGYIKMGGGFPNPAMFPIAEADFKLTDGSVIHIGQEQMREHQQYGMSEGYPDMREWGTEFQRRVHSPPNDDPNHPGHFDLLLTNGSNEGIFLSMSVFVGDGDWVLTEEATYATALEMVHPMGGRVQGVKSDADGMMTSDLEKVLTSWDKLHPGCRRPKLIYTVTSGGNPTGITWSLARKKAVYALARSHDLMLVEDDAYGLLQFVRPTVPSFLSIDVDGRVLRLDTFSKVVAPGLRVGMVSGPAPVLEKIKLQKDVSSLGPSGLSQTFLVHLLRHWGHEGFLRHADSVMEYYKNRAEMAVQCAEKHLSQLATWETPTAGMFLWLRVLGIEDSEIIVDKALERGLVAVFGSPFTPSSKKSPNIRLSYAVVNDEECDRAFRILAEVIREVRGTTQ